MDERSWRILVEAFVDGAIDAPAFEQQFLAMWREGRDAGARERYAVDLLFYEVDAYCADPALRDEHDIDEAELRAAARRCLARWDEPWPSIAP